jgi:hypothetical protein
VKFVRIFVCLAVLVTPAWATWTLTQVKDAICTASPCAVTVISTGAGHLLVAGGLAAGTSVTISSVTAGACTGSWTHATGANISQSGDGSTDQYYCLNSASGVTSISVTFSGTCSGGSHCDAVIWEASSNVGNIAVDTGATPIGTKNDATCTACAGVALSLSSNNKFITVLAACEGSCSALTGTGFTNDVSNPDSDGVGHGLNIATSGTVTSPTTWTQTSGTQVSSAVAFQESSGGGAAAGFNKRQKLDKLGI